MPAVSDLRPERSIDPCEERHGRPCAEQEPQHRRADRLRVPREAQLRFFEDRRMPLVELPFASGRAFEVRCRDRERPFGALPALGLRNEGERRPSLCEPVPELDVVRPRYFRIEPADTEEQVPRHAEVPAVTVAPPGYSR